MTTNYYRSKLKKAGKAYLTAKSLAKSTFEDYKNAGTVSTGTAFKDAYNRAEDALILLEKIFNEGNHFYTFTQFITDQPGVPK